MFYQKKKKKRKRKRKRKRKKKVSPDICLTIWFLDHKAAMAKIILLQQHDKAVTEPFVFKYSYYHRYSKETSIQNDLLTTSILQTTCYLYLRLFLDTMTNTEELFLDTCVLSMKIVTPESQSLAIVEIIPLGHKKRKPCFTGATNPGFPFWKIFLFFFFSLLKSCKISQSQRKFG